LNIDKIFEIMFVTNLETFPIDRKDVLLMFHLRIPFKI